MVWEKLIKMVKMLIYCAWPSISVHHEGVITLDMNSSCRILQWEWIAEYLHCWVAFSFTFYHWRPVSSHPENERQWAGVLLMGCSLWIGIMLLSTLDVSGPVLPNSLVPIITQIILPVSCNLGKYVQFHESTSRRWRIRRRRRWDGKEKYNTLLVTTIFHWLKKYQRS